MMVHFGLRFIVGTDVGAPTSRSARLSAATYGHRGWTCTVALHDPASCTTIVAMSNVALPQQLSDARLAKPCDAVHDALVASPAEGARVHA